MVARVSRPSTRSKSKIVASVLLGLLATACSDDATATADESDPTCIGKCDAVGSVSGALPVAAHAATWDGRVLLVEDDGACQVVAFRPEGIDADGISVTFGPNTFSEGLPCPTSLGDTAMAMLDPGMSENPFPSDAAGAPDVAGGHATYAVSMIDSNAGALFERTAHITLARPGQDDAEVVAVRWDDAATPLQLEGEHPSMTADGRLLVFEQDGEIQYARRQGDGSFGAAAALTELHSEADTPIDGLALRDRYRLADAPLLDAEGQLLGAAGLQGARPWISQDGGDLFFQAATDVDSPAGALLISSLSGHAVRRPDGSVNAGDSSLPSVRLGLGRSRGAWSPPNAPVRSQNRAVTPLFGFTNDGGTLQSTYAEVDFSTFTDLDYLLALPMNGIPNVDGSLRTDGAADISGNFRTAASNGAVTLGTPLPGARGDAAFFDAGASMLVDTVPAPERSLTVSLFVRPMAEDISGTLLDWDGIARVTIDGDQVGFEIDAEGQTFVMDATETLPMDVWTNVTMTYDGSSGELRTYVDGARAERQRFERAVPAGEGSVTLGNVTSAAGGTVVGLDEVMLSSFSRREPDIFELAQGERHWRQRNAGIEGYGDDLELPLGLDPAEIILPERTNVSPEMVELGMLLFFDNRLSRNEQVSCATCHDPEIAFTDGRPRGPHIDGGSLRRATPTIFNRSVSTAQFWDARSGTLESQATAPISSAAEMGFSIPEAQALLGSSPEYVDRFMDVFGQSPSRRNIGQALAAFERSQMAGDSPVDRFEAGDTAALTDAERRGRALFHGKARCDACHSGSNYADEELHTVGFLEDQDFGAFFRQRGRIGAFRAFKTPTLRNIDVTGPYFHNGSVETLEEVVALYVAGPTIPEADPESRPLDLDGAEQADLVAFLEALTSPNARQTFDVDLPEIP